MSEAKQLRLSKVAKEFNLALITVTEFLATKGHKVESNPNAKIDEVQYSILMKEFQGEKSAKEEAQQVSSNIKIKRSGRVNSCKNWCCAERRRCFKKSHYRIATG